MRHEHFPLSYERSHVRPLPVPRTMVGILNGVLASLALWAVIAGVVVVAS